MTYIIRLIAAIPALSIGLALIAVTVLALDYHWLVTVSIGLGFAFANALGNYEQTVDDLIHLIILLCNKTPRYNK